MATPTTKRPESTAPRRPVRNNAMLLRLISRVLVGALVVAVAIVLVAHALVGNDQNATAHLQGTSLGGNCRAYLYADRSERYTYIARCPARTSSGADVLLHALHRRMSAHRVEVSACADCVWVTV